MLTLTSGLMLVSVNSALADFIDFDTNQAGVPYAGLGDSFVSNEYNGVVINDSDPTFGLTYVNLTNPLNVGTAISGYYVNVGAFDGIQTQIVIDFTTSVSSVGFHFANPQGFLNVTPYDAGGVAMAPANFLGGDTFINQAGFDYLAGVASFSGIGNISKLVIEPNFNEALALDNLRFSPVPIPAALPLFATGLFGLGFLSRRKRRRS